MKNSTRINRALVAKKTIFLFLTLLTFAVGQVWGTPTVLFHETFGNNTGSIRAWNDSYSVKSGVSAVYSGITGYTVSNAKQGKNTTGSTQSGLNQTTQGTDAYVIIGPLSVANYESLAVTYQWKAGSTKGTYTAKLFYATASNGTYTEVSGTGNGATSFVTRSFTLPAAAQVATLYLKAVWNTSNTQGIIDEFELTGTEKQSGTPSLSSIAVQTAPTKTSYTEGEYFDPTGLVITRNYDNSTHDTYTYANHTSDFTFSPTTSTALTTSNTSVSITYGGKTTSQAITVGAAVPTLSASPTSIAFGEVASSASASQDVTVTMTNIEGNVTASLTGTDAAKFSINKNSLSSSGTITVSKNSTAIGGPYSATLSLSATGVSTVEIPISMTLIEIPTYTLKALNLIEEGDEVIIVGNNGDTYAMGNNNGTSAPTAVAVTITNDAITNPASTIIWTISPSNSGYTFYPKGSTTTWLYCTDANNGVKVGTEANKFFTLHESGYLKNSGTNRYVGIYNSQDWRCYDNTTGNIASQTFSFYVKESTTPKVNISGTMNAFSYMRDNGPSAAQTFSVRGNKLTANLVVNAPENYEICTTENGTYNASINLTPVNKTVSETTLYIRLKSGLAINSYNGNITVSSSGATNATLAVAGSVTTPVYTVTLHTNGGTINAGNVTEYTEGVGATLPTDVTKSGFSFGGWFANSDLETGGVQTTIATNATGTKEYWAKWNELPGYDITWLVDGEEYTGGEPTTRVTEGGSISSLPSTPTSLDITSKTFVGWTTAAVNEKQANAPDPLYTAASQIPGNITENKTFYAVFAQETYSGTFTKVTDASTLAAGDRLLIYASNYAAGTLSTNYLTRESVTLTNNDITNKGNASVFSLGGTSGAWTLTSAEGTLGCTAASNNSLSMTSGTTTWEISINNQGNASIHNTGYNEYIQYNSNGARFSSYTNQTAVQLYREGTSLNDYTTKFVKPVAVTGVTLNKNATTLAIGATETLTETVAPANATNKNVSWSSNATGVATVEAGVVTAVAAGEATITVTTEDGEFTDACVVTVLPTVETPTFSPAAGAINKGSKVTISCETSEATILYSIDGSDPSVAYPEGGVTITANCTLKAKATKANHTTSAVAEAAYTIIKAEQTVSFAESAYSFRLNSDEYNAFTGQTATSTYGSAVITYASSNTSVATVNTNTGVVTLQGIKGTTTITATAAEDDDYQSDSETYTITVLRAGKTRTGDFQLVTNANQLEDGDYILIAGPTSAYSSTAPILKSLSTSSTTYQTKTVANDEITYAQFLTEDNEAKIITLEKDGNNFAFNYGTDADLYISAGSTTSAHDLSSATSVTNNEKWTITIDATTHVATVQNVGNTSAGKLLCNSSNSQFRAYTSNSGAGTLYLYKQKDKNKLPQTLSFATPAYEFPLNESGYTSFTHQAVSGAQTAVTYTTSNAEVAAIEENTVVLQGGVGTATITATAAESEDYEHASATYTITVTAALNTVTFHFYKPSDATADQTALKEASSGAGITVPAKPANVGEYTFLGWAPGTLIETQTAPDNLVAALQAGATYHPATNEEYHAIYRRLENSDGRFYLMHEVSSTPNYAKAPASSTSTNFQNTTTIGEAAVFEITEDNKVFYYDGNTPRYFSSTSTTARDIDFTTNAEDAQTWTITESGTTTTFYSSTSSKYFAHNNTMWAAYASSSITQANQSKDLTKVYLAHVYYSSTPNLMVSPVLTWAQGNATHVMEIEETYDNAATATVGGEPVSVTYSSSDETKATVNNAGVVTAHLGGLVTITATVAENPGVSRQLVETYQVSITKKVPQITFDNEANWKVYVGEAYKRVLAGQVTITTDGAVTYTLSNNATSSDWASINSTTGEVTGLSTGGQSSKYQYFYVHTAETDMYQAGEAYKQFNVLALKNQALAFDQNAYVYEMNESVAPFVNTLSGAMTSVAYTSDNTGVAEVDAESGEVTVHTNVRGTATITATAAEGQVGDDVYKQVSQMYTITVNYPKPIISVATCDFKAPFDVTLSANAADVEMIVYTLDGSEPSYSGSVGDIYTEPITINATTTLKAIAVSNDEVESPVASATYTKLIPALTAWSFEDGAYVAVGTEQTITASEGAKVTYIISQGGVEVASATSEGNVATFSFAEAGNYEVEAEAQWNVENGFACASVSRTIHVKGATHLPISYDGNGTGVSSEPYFSVDGAALGTYANYSNAPIQVKENTILTIAFLDEPSNVVFYAGKNGSPWTSTLKLQESADGLTFDDVKTFNDGDLEFSNTGYGNNNGGTKQNLNLKSTTRFVRWNYTKANGNLALGKITIYPKSMEPDNSYEVPVDFTGDVVVEDGVAWNIIEEQTIRDLTVKQGAEVWNNAAITVNNLYIEAQEGKSGQITEDESITINGNAYYDLTLNTSGTMDNSKWYSFAVPFPVDAATGIQRLSNDGQTSNAGFNSHYVLLKYNSEAYASSGQGWEYMTKGETLMPGKFYMIALNSNVYNRVRMTKKTGTTLNNKADLDLTLVGTGIHANWNALANNALAYANVSATGGNASLKVQVYNSATDNYTPLGFSEVTFTVGTPFFIQVAEAGTMSVATGESNHGTIKAPQRESVATEEFQLRLGADTQSYYDILYVSASDEALNDYQIGHDLVKAGVSTTVPQMYVQAYGVKLCDAEFPLVNNEATFPLTFTAPNAGTFQLYVATAAQNAELYLMQNNNIIWNLTQSPYEIALPQGTTEGYSLLLRANAPGTGTGVDEIHASKVAQKVIINDHVYILRGGQMYDVNGKAVK